jgi:hypothetical protein
VIAVLSAGYAAKTKDLCIASVTMQVGAEFRHVYRDDALTAERKGATRNYWEMISECDPDDIIVMLDGDDELAHDHVLAMIEGVYADPEVWLTYGSFVHALDGKPGNVRPYLGENYRTSPWRGSHLKTFRAWLAHKLAESDLKKPGGEWRTVSDLVLMLPMLEMAGQAHSRFVPDVLCKYHSELSFEKTADAMAHLKMNEAIIEIHEKPGRSRLDGRPHEVDPYIAAWELGCLRKQLGYPIEAIKFPFLRAHTIRPNQLEPIYELCESLRMHQRYEEAYFYARATKDVQGSALLECDRYIDEWGMKDEYATCAAMAGDPRAAGRIWVALLRSPKLPHAEAIRITANLKRLR